MADFSVPVTRAEYDSNQKEWKPGAIAYPQVDKIENVWDSSDKGTEMTKVRFQSGEVETFMGPSNQFASAVDDRKSTMYGLDEK